MSTMMLAAPVSADRRWRNDAGTTVRHEAAIVVIETDEGITGYGEAKGSPPVIRAIVEARLRPLLLGQDPTRTEYLWESVQFAAATANCTIVERGQGYNPLLEDLLVEPVESAAGGWVVPPGRPGLGVELRPDLEKLYPCEAS